MVYHLNNLGRVIDHNSAQCDRILMIGDLNSEITEKHSEDFYGIYYVQNLVQEQTNFKNHNKRSYIDLFLRNCSKSFQVRKL